MLGVDVPLLLQLWTWEGRSRVLVWVKLRIGVKSRVGITVRIRASVRVKIRDGYDMNLGSEPEGSS